MQTLTTGIEVITPEDATRYLAANTNNRPLNAKWVRALTKEIQEGRYMLNGESVIFSDTGELLDGQHRLYAIAASGMPVSILVVRGVARDAWGTIDTGKARRAAHVLSREGFTSSDLTASICRRLMTYRAQCEGHLTFASSVSASSMELLDYANNHLDIIDCIGPAKNIAQLKALSGSSVGAWYYIASKTPGAEKVRDAALDTLVSGYPSYTFDPMMTIRERFLRATRAERLGEVNAATHFHNLIHAWNLRLANKPLQKVINKTDPVLASGFDLDEI
jgi:hypothetical protein